MKQINSKLKPLEWSQHFSNYMSMGIFPDAQGLNSQDCADAQAGLRLCCLKTTEDRFSPVEAQMVKPICCRYSRKNEVQF